MAMRRAASATRAWAWAVADAGAGLGHDAVSVSAKRGFQIDVLRQRAIVASSVVTRAKRIH